MKRALQYNLPGRMGLHEYNLYRAGQGPLWSSSPDSNLPIAITSTMGFPAAARLNSSAFASRTQRPDKAYGQRHHELQDHERFLERMGLLCSACQTMNRRKVYRLVCECGWSFMSSPPHIILDQVAKNEFLALKVDDKPPHKSIKDDSAQLIPNRVH